MRTESHRQGALGCSGRNNYAYFERRRNENPKSKIHETNQEAVGIFIKKIVSFLFYFLFAGCPFYFYIYVLCVCF